eukprot:366346-Chlamydomonas_euryale.AAC.2
MACMHEWHARIHASMHASIRCLLTLGTSEMSGQPPCRPTTAFTALSTTLCVAVRKLPGRCCLSDERNADSQLRDTPADMPTLRGFRSSRPDASATACHAATFLSSYRSCASCGHGIGTRGVREAAMRPEGRRQQLVADTVARSLWMVNATAFLWPRRTPPASAPLRPRIPAAAAAAVTASVWSMREARCLWGPPGGGATLAPRHAAATAAAGRATSDRAAVRRRDSAAADRSDRICLGRCCARGISTVAQCHRRRRTAKRRVSEASVEMAGRQQPQATAAS